MRRLLHFDEEEGDKMDTTESKIIYISSSLNITFLCREFLMRVMRGSSNPDDEDKDLMDTTDSRVVLVQFIYMYISSSLNIMLLCREFLMRVMRGSLNPDDEDGSKLIQRTAEWCLLSLFTFIT